MNRLMHIEDFLRIVGNSRLVAAGDLRHALHEFHAGARADWSKGSDYISFCDYLLSRELLTDWQLEMLFQRRFQECFFAEFKFLKALRNDHRVDSYLAQDTKRSRLVIVEFNRLRSQEAGVICRVLDVNPKSLLNQSQKLGRRPAKN